MLSKTEAVHFGVPFIGIPVFYDQHFNVEQSVKNGIAKKVELTENFDKDLENAIQEMLTDTRQVLENWDTFNKYSWNSTFV